MVHDLYQETILDHSKRPRNHHFRRELVLMPLGVNGEVEFVLSAGMLTPRASDTQQGGSLAESAAV